MIGGSIKAAVLAVFVIGLTASPAWAEGEFRSVGYPATISVEQTSSAQLITKAGTIKCKVAKGTGTLEEASPELTVTPSFSECTLGGITATAESKGSFVLKAEGSLQIKSSVAFKLKECTVTVTEQTLGKGLTYGETESGFTITSSLTGVAYTTTAGCSGGAGSFSNGEYSDTQQALGDNGQVTAGTTLLCKAAPTGTPLTCPAGNTFTEKTFTGTLEGAAVWTVSGREINCGNSNFTAELLSGGLADPGEGITAMSFSTGTGDCTSTLNSSPKVTVTAENLSWDATQATFGPAGAFVGTLAFAKRSTNVQIKMVIHSSPDVTCLYRPTSNLVAGWINATGGAASKAQFLNQSFSWFSGNPSCPSPLSFSAVYNLKRAGNNDIYLAR